METEGARDARAVWQQHLVTALHGRLFRLPIKACFRLFGRKKAIYMGIKQESIKKSETLSALGGIWFRDG